MRIASDRHQKGLMHPWVYQMLSQVTQYLSTCTLLKCHKHFIWYTDNYSYYLVIYFQSGHYVPVIYRVRWKSMFPWKMKTTVSFPPSQNSTVLSDRMCSLSSLTSTNNGQHTRKLLNVSENNPMSHRVSNVTSSHFSPTIKLSLLLFVFSHRATSWKARHHIQRVGYFQRLNGHQYTTNLWNSSCRASWLACTWNS